jgi:hypothetical protein
VADSTQEALSLVPDAIDNRAVWAQSANGPTARSPILSQSHNPETLPPLTVARGHFDGSFGHSFGNQAGENPDLYTRSGYNQVGGGSHGVIVKTLLTSMNKHITIQEEDTQLTKHQLLGRRIDYPSTLGGNAQLCLPRSTDTFASDVCPSQVPEQQWEGTHLIFASRQYSNLTSDNFRTEAGSTKSGPRKCTELWEPY